MNRHSLQNGPGVNNKTNDTTRFVFAQNDALEKQIDRHCQEMRDLRAKYETEKKARQTAEALLVDAQDRIAVLELPTENLRSRLAHLERDLALSKESVAEAAEMKQEAEKALEARSNLEKELEGFKNKSSEAQHNNFTKQDSENNSAPVRSWIGPRLRLFNKRTN